jgi:uncharacterized repeat protein (TIGR01451 family)
MRITFGSTSKAKHVIVFFLAISLLSMPAERTEANRVKTAQQISTTGQDEGRRRPLESVEDEWTIRRADLQVVSKIDAPYPIVTNNSLTYAVTARNNGPGVATGVRLSYTLPPGVIFNNCAATGGGVCGGAGQNRTVTFAILTAGASATVAFETTANCNLADGAVIINTATITGTEMDPNPANNSATAMTTASNPPPVIKLKTPISLRPPNHKYHTVDIAQMIESVSDNCPVSAGDVVIEQVASDELDDALREGVTTDDIVIAPNCRSVRLRAERAGPGNGRVYTVSLRLTDRGGAVTRADFVVRVPKGQNGVPAVKGSTAVTVIGGCP